MSCPTRSIGFALSVLMGALSMAAKDATYNSAIKLPIADVTDRVFVPMEAGKELSHAWVGQIAQGSQGFLWFSTRDSLVRYDGFHRRHDAIRAWRIDPDDAGRHIG